MDDMKEESVMNYRRMGAAALALLAGLTTGTVRADEPLPREVLEEPGWLEYGLGPTWSVLSIAIGVILLAGLVVLAWTRLGPKSGRKILRQGT